MIGEDIVTRVEERTDKGAFEAVAAGAGVIEVGVMTDQVRVGGLGLEMFDCVVSRRAVARFRNVTVSTSPFKVEPKKVFEVPEILDSFTDCLGRSVFSYDWVHQAV